MYLYGVWLAPGAHPDSPQGCLMEWVALLSGLPKTDRPQCVNDLVTSVAIHLNDTLDDDRRQELTGFIPRLLAARRDPADPRIGIRLAIWAAESIGSWAPDRLRPLHDRTVAAARARLSGAVGEEACRALAAEAAEAGAKVKSDVLYVAADAADAASADDPGPGTVNALSGALQWIIAHGDPLAWFSGLLEAHAAARAAEVNPQSNEERACCRV